MKKPVFITLLALSCLLAVTGIVFISLGTLSLRETSQEIKDCKTIKAETINDSLQFSNPVDRIQASITIENEYISPYQYVYKRENTYFLSNINLWKEPQLEKLADELYANKHGDEINYLSAVILHEEVQDDYLASQAAKTKTFNIPVSLHNFLPHNKLKACFSISEIDLYDMKNNTTLFDIALVLSHEYGHHFTNYYFGLEFSENDKNTEYYNLRAEGSDNILLSADTMDEYIENHMWYLCEIAAEDYVYFMGSEKAHRTVELMDTMDMVKFYAASSTTFHHMHQNVSTDAIKSITLCRNAIPHENIALGLPDDVEGLEEYFYSFIYEEPSAHAQPVEIGTLNLKLTASSSENHTFVWDQPYTDDDVVYTLVLYGRNDEIMFTVKTTYGDEEGTARFGYYSYSIKSRSYYYYTYYLDWEISRGTEMRARIIITFPDGSIGVSDPYDFIY